MVIILPYHSYHPKMYLVPKNMCLFPSDEPWSPCNLPRQNSETTGNNSLDVTLTRGNNSLYVTLTDSSPCLPHQQRYMLFANTLQYSYPYSGDGHQTTQIRTHRHNDISNSTSTVCIKSPGNTRTEVKVGDTGITNLSWKLELVRIGNF